MASGRFALMIAVALAGGASLAAGALWPRTVIASRAVPAMPVLASHIDMADRIQLSARGVTLRLERRGQTWCLAQNGGYPVRSAMAERLIQELLALEMIAPLPERHTPPDRVDPGGDGAKATMVRVLASSGASLGAVLVTHDDSADGLMVGQRLGDTQAWRLAGWLDAPTDPMAWIDDDLLAGVVEPVRAAQVWDGEQSGLRDQEKATYSFDALRALRFTDVRPAAQIHAVETGRIIFALAGGGVLEVHFGRLGEDVWVTFVADEPGSVALHVPPGHWAYRYPSAVLSVLELAPS